ncbi:MAG: hypothetical protein ABIT58_00150 [Ferruginibacter sp.]
MKTFSTKDEGQKCLCKKTTFSEAEMKLIVSELRKRDIRDKITIKINGNNSWIDKAGKVIPSTDRGKRPPNAVKLNQIDFTTYDDVDSRGVKIADRLFYLTGSGENISPSESNYAVFTKWFNFALQELSLYTCVRKIHFLTHIYHEAQLFGSTFEKNTTRIYHGGNFYKGRGFIQITHDYNYLEFYDDLKKTDFLKKYEKQRLNENETFSDYLTRSKDKSFPDGFIDEFILFVKSIAGSTEMAMKSAIWYWKKKKINQYADADDLGKTTAAINYPSELTKKTVNTDVLNGYEDRKKILLRCKDIFDYENCK